MCSMCDGLVEMKTWMRARSACLRASHARSPSARRHERLASRLWRSPLHKQEDAGGTHVAMHRLRLRRSRQAVSENGDVSRRILFLVVVVGVGFVVVRARRAALAPEPDRDPW